MIQRQPNESVTAFTMRKIRSEIITAELVELAHNFESAGGQWSGKAIAQALRTRLQNHDFQDPPVMSPAERV